MMSREALLVERVHLKNGRLFWRKSDSPVKGFIDREGYHRFTLGAGARGRVHHFAAHRAVWFLNHGVWPAEEIDHINRNRSDNRIENLRDVTSRENKRNSARWEPASACSTKGPQGTRSTLTTRAP